MVPSDTIEMKIYSVLKYICNNPLLEINNTIEMKILTIINNFQ